MHASNHASPTACMVLIGNELLSGRTEDKNFAWLASALTEMGIAMRRAYIIPDIHAEIVATVKEARKRFDYVFTTGGIGPTHDDITTEAVAEVFGVPVERHQEAERRLLAHYTPEQRNDARMSMADLPRGVSLIDNPVSAAPGFYMDNVFVMAGVPEIMRAMVGHIRPLLKGGTPVCSEQVSMWVPEGDIAAFLEKLQARYPQVDIGCYPLIKGGALGSTVVARGSDQQEVREVIHACRDYVEPEKLIAFSAEKGDA